MSGHSWLFTKKRGSRRTGSRISGILAEILFALLCLLSGIVGLVWIFMTYVVPEWKVHDQYVYAVCTIEDTRVVQRQVAGEDVYTPDEGGDVPLSAPLLVDDTLSSSAGDDAPIADDTAQPGQGGRVISALRRSLYKVKYKPEVLIRYEVDGVIYQNWTYDIHTISGHKYYDTREEADRMIADLKKGTQYQCWHDPTNPQRVVLVSYWTWEHWFSLIIPISLILLGGGMLAHLLFYVKYGSREYSVAASQRTSPIAPFLEEQDEQTPYPNVPDASMITDSPGVRLAYRLPRDQSFAWKLFTLLAMCVLWNIFVVGFSISSFREQPLDWIRLVFTFFFAASGVAFVGIVLKELRSTTKIGLTFVEVDRFPIRPQEPCRVFISQGGRLKMYWLNVMLVCEEEVIFTHGTNTRREVQRVFQKQLFCEEGFEITTSSPFEYEFILELPEHAMHSFVSPRNQVKWLILVEGAAAGCPVFNRVFPLIVYPKE